MLLSFQHALFVFFFFFWWCEGQSRTCGKHWRSKHANKKIRRLCSDLVLSFPVCFGIVPSFSSSVRHIYRHLRHFKETCKNKSKRQGENVEKYWGLNHTFLLTLGSKNKFYSIFHRSPFLPQSWCLPSFLDCFVHHSFTHFPSLPLSVFLSVYLSTFTVTALVSQEFNLPPSLSHPHSRSMLALSGSPSFSVTSVEIHTALCVRGMKGPLYSPSRHPALSCSSHAQPPTGRKLFLNYK